MAFHIQRLQGFSESFLFRDPPELLALLVRTV